MRNRTFVRAQRKHWALSQNELAMLLNRSPARLSRYESGEDPPDLETVLGLQVVFGAAPRKVFPSFYSVTEEAVMRRAAELDQRLVGKIGYTADRKRRLLKAMAFRAGHSSDDA